MQILSDKKKINATIVIVLMVTSAALMLAQSPIKPAEAQLSATQQTVSVPAGVTPNRTCATVSCLSFRPNPIGLGQQLLINVWVSPSVQTQRKILSEVTGSIKVTIQKPDGSNDVITMPNTQSECSSWWVYIPAAVGTYKLKMDFAGTFFPEGQWLNGYIVTNTSGTWLTSAYYGPSSTDWQTLTVQQDYVYSWPPTPLPTDYWSRPASMNNRDWWPILGNYPGTGYQGGGPIWDALYPNTNPDYSTNYAFTPWVQAPNTAHVVWKRQGALAGLTGGPAGQYGMTSSPGNPSVVYQGRCYQSVTKANGTSYAQCYDLRTGQVYYEIQGAYTPNTIAYIPPTGVAVGTQAAIGASGTWSVELIYLSGSILAKINPWTGAMTMNVSIAPLSGSRVVQAAGGGAFYNQIGGYVLSVQDLGASAASKPGGRYRLVNWTTAGTTSNLASRILSNVSCAWPIGIGVGGFIVNTASNGGSITADFSSGIAAFVGKDENTASGLMEETNVSAYSLVTGQQLWGPVTVEEPTYSPMAVVSDHGKVAFLTMAGDFIAYDLATGHQAWRSPQMDYPWSTRSFGAYAIASAYGMFYRFSYDGVYAFDWETGKIVWHYKGLAYASFESPYIDNGTEVYSFNSGGIIADGKMFIVNSEHTPTWPLTRGWSLNCINITTGELVWKVKNPMDPGAVADGYLTTSNGWDGYQYIFGKGLSTTTVTAPDVAVPLGTALTIKGTVLDESPAQPGTPCVSKDSMTLQMEYLHLQQPISGLWGNQTVTGVPVALSAIGSDGAVYNIGTTTTNGYYGTFAMAWTPTKQDTYTIMANFAGDDSYGSSGAATAVTVGPAPPTNDNNTNNQPINTVDNTPILYAIAGVGVAMILAIAVAAVLIMRKR